MHATDIAAVKRGGLLTDVDRLAREGDGWLTPEDRYALKTHGICAQAQPGVFMIRVRIPGGRASREQLHALATIAERYGHGWIHLSTRQNAELHWVDAHDVAAVVSDIAAAGLTTRSACGHTMRNVMSCPDAGVGLDEPFDCYPDAKAVSDAILARSAELNCRLPGRINLAFGGCPTCREHARLNDGGFVSTVVDGREGYELWAGGSLGRAPQLAFPLRDFLPRHDVVAAALALVDTFVTYGDLDNPKTGRMKFVVQALGEDAFRDAFDARMSTQPGPTAAAFASSAVESAAIESILRRTPNGGWGNGVRPQRTPGLAMVTVNVPLGDLMSDDCRALADASSLGDGNVYLSRNQNILFRNVPLAYVSDLRALLDSRGLRTEGADMASDVRACTGSAVCSLAIAAAPSDAVGLIGSAALARNAALRVHVSGCPNSCAQHQAADIGLAGAKVHIGGQTRVGYQVWLGADLARGRLATPVGRVAAEDAAALIDAVVGVWEALRHPAENLAATLDRVGADAFAVQVTSVAGGFAPGPDGIDLSIPSIAAG